MVSAVPLMNLLPAPFSALEGYMNAPDSWKGQSSFTTILDSVILNPPHMTLKTLQKLGETF